MRRATNLLEMMITEKASPPSMALQYGLIVPQGWRMDLVGINDPVEAYETMTCVTQEAEQTGFDSIWLFDHFHTASSQ